MMHPSEERKNELLKTYHTYWDSYMKGDIRTMADLLDDRYSQVGSAEQEVFSNKEDAVRFLHDTIGQVAGNLEMRNREISIETLEEQVLVFELCDIFVKSENDWMFYAKFRASTFMKKKAEGWKIIHQHCSIPDPRTWAGENITIDKVAAENRQLREAEKHMTAELEHRTRELEIEAALERVRSRSLAMHDSSELLEVANVLFQEIRDLGGELWGSGLITCKRESEIDEVWFANENGVLPPIELPHTKDPTHQRMYDGWKDSLDLYHETMEGKDLEAHYQHMLSIPSVRPLFEDILASGLTFPTRQTWYAAYFQYGYILTITLEPYHEAQVLTRFANVFNQAYTRFLDLKKAEAQAREAQIEAALERVRARAMAMHHTDELSDVLCALFEQFDVLGINPVLTHLTLFDEENESFALRITTSASNRVIAEQIIDVNAVEAWKQSFSNWKKSELHAVDLIDYPPESLPMLWDVLDEVMTALPDEHKIFPEDFPNGLYTTQGHCRYGYIGLNHSRRATEEEKQIVIRFAREFGRLYQRFLDLQKAEAQGREAEIEVAIERVRNKAIAMRSSNELSELMVTVFQELQRLDMELTRCLLWIFHPEDESAAAWMTNSEDPEKADSYHVPYHRHPAYLNYLDNWKAQTVKWEYILEGKEKDDWDKELVDDYFNSLPGYIRQAMKEPPKVILSGTFNKYGVIQTAGLHPLSAENQDILARFSMVFEQAYTRFQDLLRAEAQAREAQIEASLERVRAAGMAMHSSSEIKNVAHTLHEQLRHLGLLDSYAKAQIHEIEEGSETVMMWSTDFGAAGEGIQFEIDVNDISKFRDYYEFFSSIPGEERKQHTFTLEYRGQEFEELADWAVKNELLTKEERDYLLQTFDVYYDQYALFAHGSVVVSTFKPLTQEQFSILRRFAVVFEQTYVRFLDLKKAEGQAREAQIQLALERVRARTMAMHQSQELAETASVLFEQFEELGGMPDRMNICFFHEYEHVLELWSTEQGGYQINQSFRASLDEPTTISKIYQAWKSDQKSITIEQEGLELKKWIDYVRNEMGMNFSDDHVKGRRFQTGAFFSRGLLILSSNDLPPREMINLLERFADVFNLTYTRFLDLKKAEARARAAKIEASLERVRAEIASMRSPADLQRITPLIWQELTTLDVPFFRCGVFIMDKEVKIVHVYLSDPAGNSLGAMHLPFDAGDLTVEAIKSWESGLVYTKHWDKDAFIQWMQLMQEMGQIQDADTFQGTDHAPESLDLHFIPFKQGMLYVGNDAPLENEMIELVESLAESFSIAYARYEDFIKIEKAKEQVENTLSELKQAQTQLIHSEKMASLGELTAGIAHEIQNPLNFVNNFSDVSNELIEEMYEEIEKGDLEEAMAIANDIRQNLEKINHHGKRADSIVKGMLQHSRTSSGENQPTDINKLTDEYLRLAYHGMRARDKTFNASMHTDYDMSAGSIDVIPQEIGRVILNLITNAFYAVSEKDAAKRENGDPGGYEPTVTVRTRKTGDNVLISVEDNGNGIPRHVLDKIFQPFFTTKPTGQGTGLGLSLSYDIVQAHQGKIKVNTEQGKFTKVQVLLPA